MPADLEEAVWQDNNEADGDQEIDFGNCVNANEYISRPCAVGYSNRTTRGGHTQVTIYHCGPSSRGRFD